MNRIPSRILLVLALTSCLLLILAAAWAMDIKAFFPEAGDYIQEGTASAEVQTEPVETISAETEPIQTEPTEPTQTQLQEERFLLTFVGDCTLGCNPINYYAQLGFVKTVGTDYGYPFRNVLSWFENDEFTMINLEGPLCDEGYPVQKEHTFHGPTDFVNILTENSVEAVTVANNHTLDYGQQGYDSTLTVLEQAGIPYVERDSSTLITTENGLVIGLYAMVYYYLDVEDMTAEIAALKEQGAQLIIVAPHWGTEGSYLPTAEQENVGHAAIDAGADIVYGSHPHVLQPVEEYNDGIIYYSLGNFSFGGNGCPDDFDTAIIQQEVVRSEDGSVHLGQTIRIPACISSTTQWNNFQPTPYEENTEGYRRVMSKLNGTWCS